MEIFEPSRWQHRLSEIADTATVVDSLTPFVHKQINGRPAWRIAVNDVDPQLLGTQYDVPSKDCEVLVDRYTGQIIVAIFKEQGSDTLVRRMPTAKEAEGQLSLFGEKYTGMPVKPPTISLRVALDSCRSSAPVYEQTIVHYVMYSWGGDEPQPVWVVYERSKREIGGRGGFPQSELYKVSNRRTVINATTFQMYTIPINAPYPRLEGHGLGTESDGN
jgi:hypothetical protein